MEKREQAILGRIFESFTQFENIDGVKRQLIQSLCELVEADAGRLFSPAGVLEPTTWAFQQREELELQFDAYFRFDPLCQRMLKSPQSVFNQSEFEGALAWCESTLYRSLLNPLGLHDGALMLLRIPHSAHGADGTQVLGDVRWCIWFGHHRRNGLTRRRLRTLENIAPQLYAGLNNLCAWHERWKRTQAIESMLHFTDDLLVCISLTQVYPRLVAATRAAQNALGIDPVKDRNNPHFCEFLELAVSLHPGATGVWRAPSGRAFRLSAMPARETADSAPLRLVRLEPLGVLNVQGVRVSESPAANHEDHHAARVAGLSAREAAVFAGMSRGLGNREIAQELGISIDTVRAHLRNIFAKLEVCSRVEAVNAVRNRTRDDLLRSKLDSSIDRPTSETNVHGNAGAGRVEQSAGLSNVAEPSTHGFGIAAQIT